MKACRRCGYVYPCPPAPYYTPQAAITPSVSQSGRSRVAILVGVGAAFLALVLFLAWLGARPAAYRFEGAWHGSSTGRIAFNRDGSFEGWPPGWANSDWQLSWKRSGPFVQLIHAGQFPATFTYQWTVSDDGQMVTLIDQATGKLYTATRAPN